MTGPEQSGRSHPGPSHIAPPIKDFLDRLRFPAADWKFTEAQFSDSDLGKTETLFALGNGYLGMRGNVEEGRDTHSHGTFINGFHETWPIQHAEEAFGFARVGQTMVNVPDAKVIRLYVDDEPLLLPVADLLHYDRTIDFRTGVLSRDILWRTPGGKRVHIRSRRMVSFTQRHLAVLTFDVTMLDDAAPVAISSQILNRQDGEDEYHVPSAAMGEGIDPRRAERIQRRVLVPQTHGGSEQQGRVMMGYQCANSKMTLGVAADHHMETSNHYTQHIHVDDDTAKMTYRIDAQPGQTISLTKVVSYHTSRGVPSRELIDRCRRTLDRVEEESIDHQFAQQQEWLDKFWERSDVEVPGQPEIQQALRWNLFQIAQASARGTGGAASRWGLRSSSTSATQTMIIAIDSRKCPATIHGLRSVNTVMPPMTACSGIPRPTTRDSRVARRCRAPRAARKHRTAIAASAKVSSRLPNSIAPWRPSSPWATYDASVQRGHVGQPSPDPVRRTAAPVTTMPMLATRLATASGHNLRERCARTASITPT